ncbi:MAG: polysaccharide deacetylase family protein [Clostridiales bacterium]|nr:polysaccharide deacetylase family protein [Clostridiales bacterium]
MSRIKVASLIYHDISFEDKSNICLKCKDLEAKYLLTSSEFKTQVSAVSKLAIAAEPVGDIKEINEIGSVTAAFLTFDDGYSSIVDIAHVLESEGLKGYFFIIGDRIGQKGYATKEELQKIRRKGHVIGTHSYTHPRNISRLEPKDIIAEWKKGIEVLQDILGEEILTAAVPGGFTSRRVIRAAAEAGIKLLFTSEPLIRVKCYPDIVVLGRYNITSSMNTSYVTELLRGNRFIRLRQFLIWNIKKVIKTVMGRHFVKIKSMIYLRHI